VNWIKQEIRNLDRSARALRKFGFVMGGAFAVLGLLSKAGHGRSALLLFVIAAFFVVTAWLAPRLLTLFHIVWMTFAIVLGWVMTTVILTAVFFIVFVPLGVLQRLSGKGQIDLAIQKERASYWQAKPEQPVHSDYERQF